MEMGDGASISACLHEALSVPEFVNIRPSVVAAALLYQDRKFKGKVKLWPSSLMHLTGIDVSDTEFQAALFAANKLESNIHSTPPNVLDVSLWWVRRFQHRCCLLMRSWMMSTTTTGSFNKPMPISDFIFYLSTLAISSWTPPPCFVLFINESYCTLLILSFLNPVDPWQTWMGIAPDSWLPGLICTLSIRMQ